MTCPATTPGRRSTFTPGSCRRISISSSPRTVSIGNGTTSRDWNDAWQVQNLGLADLIDIAQEPGTTNKNFGATEGSTFPKIKFVRHPNNPEYYCFLPNGTYVGFGPSNGITTQMLADNPGFYGEYVQDFLNRAARWEMDRTKADGLRLDAVKHVRADFFGAGYGTDKDYNDYGYLGQAQRQFNLTRGFNDSRFNSTRAGFERQPARVGLRYGKAAAQRDDVRRAPRRAAALRRLFQRRNAAGRQRPAQQSQRHPRQPERDAGRSRLRRRLRLFLQPRRHARAEPRQRLRLPPRTAARALFHPRRDRPDLHRRQPPGANVRPKRRRLSPPR